MTTLPHLNQRMCRRNLAVDNNGTKASRESRKEAALRFEICWHCCGKLLIQGLPVSACTTPPILLSPTSPLRTFGVTSRVRVQPDPGARAPGGGRVASRVSATCVRVGGTLRGWVRGQGRKDQDTDAYTWSCRRRLLEPFRGQVSMQAGAKGWPGGRCSLTPKTPGPFVPGMRGMGSPGPQVGTALRICFVRLAATPLCPPPLARPAAGWRP